MDRNSEFGLLIPENQWRHAAFYQIVERNYREALLHLEAQGKIGVEPPADGRGTRSGQKVWGSGTRASFPR